MTPELVDAMTELFRLRNRVAHGAELGPNAGRVIDQEAPKLLRTMDALLEGHRPDSVKDEGA